MKPGWKTSEFYLALAAHVFAAITLFDPSAADLAAKAQPIVQAAAVIAAAIAGAYYSHSRGNVKAALTPVP